MKDTSIRFRVSEAEKANIEDFGRTIGTSVSELLRQAAGDVLRGDVPGARQRQLCADVRRWANLLLEIMDTPPIDSSRFRVAVVSLHTAARELIQS